MPVNLGATPRQAVFFIYFVAVCLALGAVMMRSTTVLLSSGLHVLQAVMILGIVVILMRQSVVSGRRNQQLQKELDRLKQKHSKPSESPEGA